ncbi:hypothetical protein [Mesorhizobium sp. M0998]|uniref:hypothetical protein n=1 Tax=Mesorhizobium sp. M0998 TaxID=2957044 RepID=UPI0033384626
MLEDKIVQSAVAEVLSAVYEPDFPGFSYCFRPGRSPTVALDDLHTGIMSQRVNWVLDAAASSTRSTTSGCCGWWRTGSLILVSYGTLGCGCGLASLRAARSKRRTGVPQGAGISPLLANILLHYILDLWAHQWRRRHAHGCVVIVRYADELRHGL